MPWSPNFPDTIIDKKLKAASTHPLYELAKGGDIVASITLAKDLVSEEAIEQVRKLIGSQKAVTLPVHAEEATGRNKIPVAVSIVLARNLNLDVCTDIIQATQVSRTGGDGWFRLANRPAFDGKIDEGTLVLMVDDTQTQGGTFAALKAHVESQGARVLGSYALTGKQYSVQLRLSEATLQKLGEKYERLEKWWQNKFGYGFQALTEWEARYLLNSGKTPDEVRTEILARRP